MNAKVAEALRQSDASRAALVRSLSPDGRSGAQDGTGEAAVPGRGPDKGLPTLLLLSAVAAGLAAAALLPLTAFETGRLRPAVRALGKGAVTVATDVALAHALAFCATVLGRASVRPAADRTPPAPL